MSCSNCGLSGHTRRTCQDPPNQYYTCTECGNAKHVGEFPYPPRRSKTGVCSVCRKRPEFCCTNCGETGHLKTHCPLPIKEKKGCPGSHCAICGYSGHNRRTCPLRTDEHSVPRRKRQQGCSICGDPKHTRTTCQMPADGMLYCRKCDKRIPKECFWPKPARGKDYMDPLCKEHRKAYNLQRRHKTPETWMGIKLVAARGRARKDKLEFDLIAEDLYELFESQNGLCYYSGVEMSKDSCSESISIDRLDNSKGYTPDNIVLSCWRINNMKCDLNHDQFIATCKKIAERFNDYPG